MIGFDENGLYCIECKALFSNWEDAEKHDINNCANKGSLTNAVVIGILLSAFIPGSLLIKLLIGVPVGVCLYNRWSK